MNFWFKKSFAKKSTCRHLQIIEADPQQLHTIDKEFDLVAVVRIPLLHRQKIGCIEDET